MVDKHFVQLQKITVGEAEKAAINDLHASYKEFVLETSSLFDQNQGISNDATKNAIKRTLNSSIETELFKRYEDILAHTESLLSQKQFELNKQLIDTKRTSTILLIIPLILAVLLLMFSRVFLMLKHVKLSSALSTLSTGWNAGQVRC